MTGGGTGGHITPILAVAHELKKLDPSIKTIYVGEKGSNFASLTKDHQAIDNVYKISAGKLRRYHGDSWIKRIFDINSNIKNIRDMFKVIIGVIQAWLILGKVKPDVVFLKGGFVGVPIGLAAAFRRIPIVTHDSDAMPGLANRLVSRWAKAHATALDAKYYKYPKDKIYPVGVLVEQNYQPVNDIEQAKLKQSLGINPKKLVLLITGGSSGAERINIAIVKIINKILDKHPDLFVIHQVGKGKTNVYNNFTHNRLKVLEFMYPMYTYTGAADLIITRAGANAIAEFGTQGKACIVIPNPDLTGGHQTHNAELLAQQGSALVLTEEYLSKNNNALENAIELLLNDEVKRRELANKLQSNTIKNAGKKLAELLLNQMK